MLSPLFKLRTPSVMFKSGRSRAWKSYNKIKITQVWGEKRDGVSSKPYGFPT
eukprot:m.168857 g.168857  ORF g.168857 m.168857 type:complete len:52 (+) comp25090_c0_seq12:2462-2617(+)